MPQKQVLVVEDNESLLETLRYNLEKQGYSVLTATTGPGAVEVTRQERPDLVLLDIMLPGFNGHEVCRILRRDLSTPIIMLTARTESFDKVFALEMGVDDYITKPFHMRELLARIKALLRRIELIRREQQPGTSQEPGTDRDRLVFGNLVLDQARYEVLLDDQVLHLKPREYELLLFLARHRGIVLSRDLILERVWGHVYEQSSRTVDVHVRWLRQKIEPNPQVPRRIISIRGVGYRFDG